MIVKKKKKKKREEEGEEGGEDPLFEPRGRAARRQPPMDPFQ